jgi:protein-disulfide isomerase
MSGKQARRRRQAAAPPPVRRKGARRQASPKVLLGAALAVLVLAGAAVGITLAVSGKSSSSSVSVPARGSLANAPLSEAAAAYRLFSGIPERGNVLGSPTAPATMVEYVDLQCPHCRDFEATVMPTILGRFVRPGKLKVEARPIAIIGSDSLRGRDAAIAAAQQNRMFPFMQVTYFNQGTENTGWLNDDFVKQAAASVPGMDVPKLVDAAGSSAVAARSKTFDAEASADNVPGTPGLYVGRSGGKLEFVPSNDATTVLAAIRHALS